VDVFNPTLMVVSAIKRLMKENMEEPIIIKGLDEDGRRTNSKVFEERVQEAIEYSNHLILETYGQHNIGGRLDHVEGSKYLETRGPVGQRLGFMGRPGTKIVCKGSASDDVGYLNIGADIIVQGDATNGVCNAMAEGRVQIAGSIGARGLSMTKWNPDYEKPELWVLGSVGDFFAEFNCGGIGVVCGIEAKAPRNVLGYRPCVGMVGGMVFYRGRTDGSYSKNDVKNVEPNDEQWEWLIGRLPEYLENIDRMDLLTVLSDREDWYILLPMVPQEKEVLLPRPMPMSEFYSKIWMPAFAGPDAPRGGDPLRDVAPGLDRSVIGLIETGDLRRRAPLWQNKYFASPCTYNCPIHIPTVDRLRLMREGKPEEAYNLVMKYTPLPASVCGHVCPNLCMDACSRQGVDQQIQAGLLGQALESMPHPETKPSTGKRVAVIGGGPGGISAAWQLAQEGIEAHIFESDNQLGGKLAQVIPWDRLPLEVWETEIGRFTSMPNITVNLNVVMTTEKLEELKETFEYIIIAVGTHSPRRLNFKGSDGVLSGLDFLKAAKSEKPMVVGQRVAVIGAGNVGCDIACEAYRLGAEQVTLVDVQKPLAFGKEKEAAEVLGAVFKWPVVTQEVNDQGLIDSKGELIPAQTVIISIGDVPALDFLPEYIERVNAAGAEWIKTGEGGQTSDSKIFAIGDVEKPGLATHALGAGKTTAEYIISKVQGKEWKPFKLDLIDVKTLTMEHYFPEKRLGSAESSEADRCMSCGSCRDCELCEFMCPENAISRKELEAGGYEYTVDEKLCIACGFCVETCPCGIWQMSVL